MYKQSHKTRFISLRWKSLFLFSLLLVSINFGLSYIASSELKHQFQKNQRSLHHQYRQQLDALIKQGKESLWDNAYVSRLSFNSRDDTSDTLSSYYQDNDNLLLDLNLDFLVFYPEPEHIKPVETDIPLPDNHEYIIKRAYQEEQPVSGIYCLDTCRFYAAVPLLKKDTSTGILLLGQSIASLLTDFSSISQADLAIVNTETQRNLAVTHAGHFSEFVTMLLKQDKTDSEDQRIHSWQNHKYSVEHLSLIPAVPVEFWIISDITTMLADIDKATTKSFAVGLMGLVLSELMLFALLKTPLQRVRLLSENLPLLSDDRHEEFRQIFARKKNDHALTDELDILETTTVTLSQQLEATERNLTWQAEHDALTGLKNRHRFHQDFELILNHAIRFNHPGALLYFDLDQFKYVNDTSGHQTGDTLLRLVAKNINELIRKTDFFARLGGDEFAIILPETDQNGAMEMADKILLKLEKISIPSNGYTHKASASIGIVLFPEHGETVSELVSNGDIAMYQAKEKGHGKWHLYSPTEGIVENLHHHLYWKEIIENAIESNQLVLHFQPILHIGTKTVSHHEALVRIRHNQDELLPPGKFIPEAEKNNLIQDIDFKVLEMSVSYLSMIQDESTKLAVNLSGKVMNSEKLVPFIIELLSSYQVAPARLIFEVTETAAVADIMTASKIMRQINAIGCHFALDDFGIGFSSFFYLKQLPVKYIKIDGAFIRDLVVNKDDQLFVKALNTVITGLGKYAIAEFVENQETLELLEQFGIEFAQGYHIGKPEEKLMESYG